MDQLRELSVSPENLCPTGAQLYETAISSPTSIRNFDIHEIPVLLEFYRRSVSDLALQYANHSRLKSQSQLLTAHETERLIHEATQKERMILEDAVAKKYLPIDDAILSKITERFSILIMNNEKFEKNFKILL